jgi:hypothetical protein
MVRMSLTSADREGCASLLLVPYINVANCTQFSFGIYSFYFITFVQVYNIFGNNYLFTIAFLHVSMFAYHPQGVSFDGR